MGHIIPNWREGNLLLNKISNLPVGLCTIADAWHMSRATAWQGCLFSIEARTAELVSTDMTSFGQAVTYQAGTYGRCEGLGFFLCFPDDELSLCSVTASVTERLGSIVRVSADELTVRCQILKMWQLWYLLCFISGGVCFGGLGSLFCLACKMRILQRVFKKTIIFSLVWLFLLLFCCCLGFYLVLSSFDRQELHCTWFSVRISRD